MTKNPGTQEKTCEELNFDQVLFRMSQVQSTCRGVKGHLRQDQSAKSICEQALHKERFEPNFALILLVSQKENFATLF